MVRQRRSNGTLAHFFFGTFFLLIALGNEWVTEKSALSPDREKNFVRRREFVRKLECVDPLSPTAWELPPAGSLLVASLPRVGNGVCAQRGVG